VTLSPLAILSVLLVPLLLGAGLVRLLGLRWRDDPLAYPVWCALTGGLGTAGLLFVWSWLEWPYDARLMVPVLLAMGAASGWLGRRAAGPPRPELARPARRGPRVEALLFGVVVLLMAVTTVERAIRTSSGAIALGDEAVIWHRKAQILFDAGGMNEAFGLHGRILGSHEDYPMLNPLLQVWAFAHARDLLWIEARIPIQVFALSLVLVQAAALRRILRPAAAALVLAIVFFVDASTRKPCTATADPMVALGLVVATDAGLRWLASRAEAWGRLFFVALAFLAATKHEGALLGLCVFLGCATCLLASRTAWRRPAARHLAWAALPLAVLAAGWFVNLHFGFRNKASEHPLAILTSQFGERIGPILSSLAKLFFLRPRWNAALFALLIVLSLLAPGRVLRGRARPVTLGCWFVLGAWLVVYLTTPYDLDWHLISSAPRITYHAVPALGLWLALMLAQDPWFGRFVRARRAASTARRSPRALAVT
jgi:hypothetical protein